MKISIKFVCLLIYFLNTQLWGWVEVKKPIEEMYFSIGVLSSAAKAAQEQLFLGYSYYSKIFSTKLALCEFDKLSSKKRAEIQDFFHTAKKVYEALFEEFDFLRKHLGKDIKEIDIVYFEFLIKNLALLHEFFNCDGNLKLNFENCEALNDNVLNKIKSDKEKVEMTFEECCKLIDELFIFNDVLIRKNAPKNIFSQERKPFIFGYLEYSSQEAFPVPPQYLFVSFPELTF